MDRKPTEVLNHRQVEDKIVRMAWQIYEEYYDQEAVVLAGIADRGFRLAEKLKEKLEAVSPLQCSLYRLEVHKEDPLTYPAKLHPAEAELEDKHIVVIDDVLKSGATLIYGVRYFLDFPIRSMKTVVLVDRNHKRYPVKADFKGLSLSTSTQQHVQVQLAEAPFSVTVS